jgi:hypothetical protein
MYGEKPASASILSVARNGRHWTHSPIVVIVIVAIDMFTASAELPA